MKLRTRTTIAVATSAVAAALLDEDRTAHSAFKIPIPCYSDSVCHILLESALAAKIRDADLIIWYEIVIWIRYCVEAVVRTLRAIMEKPLGPFGRKSILFSGDFRQILPIVPRGSCGMVVHLCLKSSPIFKDLKLLHLTENMQLQSQTDDPNADEGALNYPNYLLEIGEGKLKVDNGSQIDLTPSRNVV